MKSASSILCRPTKVSGTCIRIMSYLSNCFVISSCPEGKDGFSFQRRPFKQGVNIGTIGHICYPKKPLQRGIERALYGRDFRFCQDRRTQAKTNIFSFS